jgi:signal transduction histidine kinase
VTDSRLARATRSASAMALGSIAQKVMAVGFVAFTLGILLTVMSGFLVYDDRLQRREDSSNIRFTRLIADQVAPGIHIDRKTGVSNALREYTAAAGGDLGALATYTDTGERLTYFRRDGIGDVLPARIDPDAHSGASRSISERGGLIVPARLPDDRVAGYVVSYWQNDALDAIRWEALLYSFGAAGAAWLLSGALLWVLLQQVVTNPIRRLTGVVLQFSGEAQGRAAVDDPEVTAAVATHRERRDEIGRMAQALDLLTESERERRRAERALADAKRETDDILATVDEGLFLIRQDEHGHFVIAEQHSRALVQILGSDRIAGETVLDVLSPHLDKAERDDVNRFLRLLFEPRVEQQTLDDLNPLSDVEANVAGRRRYLRFHFQRVVSDNAVAKVLAIVTDRTETVELSQQVEETERRARSRMALLARVLETDPGLLQDFMAAARRDIAEVDAAIRPQSGPIQVSQAFRAAHAIKGNAALLELDFVVERAHALEDALSGQQEASVLAGIADDLRGALTQLDDVVSRLAQFRDTFGRTDDQPSDATVKAIRTAVAKSAEEAGKQAGVVAQGFDVSGADTTTRLLVKDALVQLVRNAVHHGIERPEARRRAGKSPDGTITLASGHDSGRLTVSVSDDGRGLDTDRLGAEAGARMTGDVGQSAQDLIFERGVSTAEGVSEEAGRGIGLDLVRERIRAAGGEIAVDSEPGRYTRFDITLPLGQQA